MEKPHIGASGKVAPFLARFAIARADSQTMPGRYSEEEGMWLIDTPSGQHPIIDFASDLTELTTKTKVDTESDDSETQNHLLELTTKTDAGGEGDDQFACATWLALTTKTSANAEHDDIEPRGMDI